MDAFSLAAFKDGYCVSLGIFETEDEATKKAEHLAKYFFQFEGWQWAVTSDGNELTPYTSDGYFDEERENDMIRVRLVWV